MHTVSTSGPNADGRTLYRAAIYESDSSLVLRRVSAAVTAALNRQRELFYLGGSQEEKDALRMRCMLYRHSGLLCGMRKSRIRKPHE